MLAYWGARHEPSEGSRAGGFIRTEVIQQVRELYQSKALSEMTIDDLLSVFDSSQGERLSGRKKADLHYMLSEELKLNAEEIKSLGVSYQESNSSLGPNSKTTITDTPESGIRKSSGLKPVNGL